MKNGNKLLQTDLTRNESCRKLKRREAHLVSFVSKLSTALKNVSLLRKGLIAASFLIKGIFTLKGYCNLFQLL